MRRCKDVAVHYLDTEWERETLRFRSASQSVRNSGSAYPKPVHDHGYEGHEEMFDELLMDIQYLGTELTMTRLIRVPCVALSVENWHRQSEGASDSGQTDGESDEHETHGEYRLEMRVASLRFVL